jgi:hypothetical protein
MIDNLLYLTASSLDIMFDVCLCVRYQANSKESHLSFVKKFLYIKRIKIVVFGMISSPHFNLIGFTDVNFVGNQMNKKVQVGLLRIYYDR